MASDFAGCAASAAGAAKAAAAQAAAGASVIKRLIFISPWCGRGVRAGRQRRHRPAAAASTSGDFANSVRFFANVGSMQFTQRQRLSWRGWRPLLAAMAVGLLLG